MKLNFLKKAAAVLTASLMTLSMVVPAMATGGEATQKTTKVYIHKIKMPNLNGWPKAQNPDGTYPGVTGPGYDGRKINSITDYFGTGAEELAGVYFKYYELTKDQYEAVSTAPDNDSEASIQAIFTDRGWGAVPTPKETRATTGDNDNPLDVDLKYPEGGEAYYWFIEVPRNLAGGQTLAGAAAVPFGITLPLYNKNGVAFDAADNPLHVYPKNTVTDKPDVKKTIDTNKAKVGGAYPYNIGDEVPYTITTVVKKNSNYATLRWSDSMTEGLTLIADIRNITESIKVKLKNNANLGDGTGVVLEDRDYTVDVDEVNGQYRGFTLKFTETGLAKVKLQPDDTTITITYKAELNEKAEVAITESNDVTFNYGNNPSEGNSPKPSKPSGDDNKLKVKKLVDGNEPTDPNLSITVTLYNAQTNEAVNTDPVKVLNQGNNWQEEWTGLDKDTEYYVVETITDGMGFTPTYSVEDGNFKINNKKTDNPPPISPEKPKVVTFGKQFIKVEKGNDNKKLAGAKFVVGKTVQDGATTKNQYLVLKTEAEQTGNLNTYNTKETAYQNALNATYNSDTEREAAVSQAKTERDTAYKALILKWKWEDEVVVPPNQATPPTNAFTFTTGEDGKFAIVGLESGTYFLKETMAPVGYVLNTNNIAFTIVDGESWRDATGIEFHTKVPNSKVTIPQTGGIGTILFTLAGATLMGGAVFAMKKRDEDEEE